MAATVYRCERQLQAMQQQQATPWQLCGCWQLPRMAGSGQGSSTKTADCPPTVHAMAATAMIRAYQFLRSAVQCMRSACAPMSCGGCHTSCTSLATDIELGGCRLTSVCYWLPKLLVALLSRLCTIQGSAGLAVAVRGSSQAGVTGGALSMGTEFALWWRSSAFFGVMAPKIYS
jgi:hypothetical protein